MMTIAQQIAARSPIYSALTRNVFVDRTIDAGCAYLLSIAGPTAAGGLFALPAPEVEVLFEDYRGWPIVWESGYGFAASRGPDHVGWCDTIEEVRAEIDDEIADRRRSYAAHFHEDTPALDTSFHDYEMNVEYEATVSSRREFPSMES